MRRLNKKLVIALAAALVLLVGLPTAWLIHRRPRKPNISPILATAERLVTEGKVDEAVIRYLQVVRLDPSCDAAHLALGEIEEKRGDLSQALERYRIATRANAHNKTAITRLASLCEKVGLFEPLGATADRLLALEPGSADGHFWKALSLRASKDHDRALAEAKEAMRLDPSRVEAVILLAELHAAKDHFALSESLYKGALEAHPDDPKLRLGLGRFYEARKDYTNARAQYERAAKATPGDASPLLHLAGLFARQEQPAVAEKWLLLAVERCPQDRSALFAYSDFLVNSGRFADARKRLEQALSAGDWPEFRALLVDALLSLGEPDKAREQIEKLPGHVRAGLTGKYLEGRLLLAEGKAGEAAARLRDAIQLAPRLARAHFYLGLAHAAQDELDSAHARFEEAARLEPKSLAIQGQLALTSLALQRYDAAVAAARAVLAARPDDEGMRRTLARALVARGEIPAAVQELDTAIRQSKDPAAVTIELASLRIGERRFDEAAKLIQSLPPEARAGLPARMVLARVYRAIDRVDDAEKELLAAAKESPHAAAPRELLAAICRQRNRAAEAVSLLEGFAKAEPTSVPAHLALAQLQSALGHLPEALAAGQRAEKLDPASWPVADLIIGIQLALKKPEDALATARRAAEAKPAPLAARLAVPRALLALRKPADAAQALQPLVKELPHEAQPPYFLGVAFTDLQDLPKAIEQFRRAVQLRPDWLEARYRLAEACFRSGLYLDALTETDVVLSRRPDLRPARLMSAISRAQGQDYARALEDYLAAEPPQPDPGYFVGLSQLYLRNAQHPKAEQALLRAYALAPESPTVLTALTSLYETLGKAAEAEKVVQRFLQADAQKPFPHILLARHCEAIGRLGEAEKAYRRAVELDAKSPAALLLLGRFLLRTGRAADACGVYRQATDKGSPQARAELVSALLASGQVTDARQELTAALKANPADPALLTERARLLLVEARHDSSGQRLDECRDACEKAIGAAPSSVDALLILAEMHLADRAPRRLAAVSALQRAAALAPDAMPLRLHLARLQIGLGNLADAEKECRSLLAMSPAAPAPLEVLASIFDRRRRPEDPPEATPQAIAREFPAHPALPLLRGRALAAERKWDAAEAQFRAYLRGHPDEGAADLARVLIAAGKPAEAVAACEAHLKDGRGRAHAHELLASAHAANGQPAKAAEALEAALRLDPGEPRLVAALAQAHIAAKAPEKALASCKAYIAAWPADARGHLLLGRALLIQKNNAGAEQAFARAAELDPRSTEALELLTATQIGLKRFDEAVAACKAFQKANPNSAPAWHLLARVQIAQGQLDDARMALTRALSFDAKLFPARMDLGNLYLLRKDYERAIEQYEQALAQAPDHPETLNNLAWSLAELGKDLDRAKAVASHALKIDPSSPSSLDTLGWIGVKRAKALPKGSDLREANQELDEALAAFRRSLELRPDSPTTRYHLAFALAEKGQPAEARKEVDRALALKSPFPEADAAKALLVRLQTDQKRE